jgi:nitroimidazol reductase NimA-like FMN-containing flavoprotein (pyridoxamine 5'-phosphate oxidase superfamily)
MKNPPVPDIRELSAKEAEVLLRRNRIGRLAYTYRNKVDIRPLHYAWRRGWLFGRTSPGDKLMKLTHNQWVAFEIDEIDNGLDWKSVIVRGTFYMLKPEGSSHDVRLFRRAVRAIRELAPFAFTDDDPVAFRSEVFGIAIDTVTGRSSSTRARAPKRR